MSQPDQRGPGPRVLLASPLPPPHGGIATWTRIVLEQGFCGEYVPIVVNTSVSSRRATFEEEPELLDELGRNLRLTAEFALELVRSRPVLVHLNSGLSPRGMLRDLLMAALARAVRLPVVVQYHGPFPEPTGTGRGRVGRWALRRLVRLASANLVLSGSFLAALRRAGGGRADRALPNFIDAFALGRPPADRSARVGPMRVIYVGSLIPSKGSLELVAAAQRLPELEFSAVGVLPSDDRLDAPPNLQLAGPRSRADVLAAMESADVLFFPSHGEGFPYAVLEAMTARLPVVASRVGAIPDMIDEGRGGFLLDPGDVDGLCTALAALSADPGLPARMGVHNRARVEADYTHAQVMARLAQVYDEVRASSR